MAEIRKQIRPGRRFRAGSLNSRLCLLLVYRFIDYRKQCDRVLLKCLRPVCSGSPVEVIIDDMIIYSASQSLIKTVSAGVGFFSVPAKAKAFLFKRKPGYKAHYRFTRALISIALRNIQLFNMQLTAVSGRGIKNIATCRASNVIAAARSDHRVPESRLNNFLQR